VPYMGPAQVMEPRAAHMIALIVRTLRSIEAGSEVMTSISAPLRAVTSMHRGGSHSVVGRDGIAFAAFTS
jgi:hypothetical protein